MVKSDGIIILEDYDLVQETDLYNITVVVMGRELRCNNESLCGYDITSDSVNVQTIIVSDNKTSIYSVLGKCSNSVTNVILSSQIYMLGDIFSLAELSSVSFRIPPQIRGIYANDFRGCYMKEVVIPDTVEFISPNAFSVVTDSVERTGEFYGSIVSENKRYIVRGSELIDSKTDEVVCKFYGLNV